MAEVYLIHFESPLQHAHHYVGFSYTTAENRFKTHLSGNGAKILAACNRAGIKYKISRVWKNEYGTRAFERKLKKAGHVNELCPICNKKVRNPLPVIGEF